MDGYLKKEEKEFKKDCPNYNYLPTVIESAGRIIAIGDLHGDYKLTLDVLKLAKVIDNNLNWTGGDTIVVQVGDQVDRCRPYRYKCNDSRATHNDEASDIKILKLMTDLHNKALPSGGKVISLLGNHELLNVRGRMSYVSHMGLREFDNYVDPDDKNIRFEDGLAGRIHAFKPGNEYGKFLGCTRTSVLIIRDTIFIHAGLLPEIIKNINLDDTDFGKLSPEEINRLRMLEINKIVRRWLLKLGSSESAETIEKIVGEHSNTLFWTRVFGKIPSDIPYSNPKCEKYLKDTLKLLKLNHMIIGHTPQFANNAQGINNTCGDKLWRVDFGGSTAFKDFDNSEDGSTSNSRIAQVLEISENNKFKVLKYEDQEKETNDTIDTVRSVSDNNTLKNLNRLFGF